MTLNRTTPPPIRPMGDFSLLRPERRRMKNEEIFRKTENFFGFCL